MYLAIFILWFLRQEVQGQAYAVHHFGKVGFRGEGVFQEYDIKACCQWGIDYETKIALVTPLPVAAVYEHQQRCFGFPAGEHIVLLAWVFAIGMG